MPLSLLLITRGIVLPRVGKYAGLGSKLNWQEMTLQSPRREFHTLIMPPIKLETGCSTKCLFTGLFSSSLHYYFTFYVHLLSAVVDASIHTVRLIPCLAPNNSMLDCHSCVCESHEWRGLYSIFLYSSGHRINCLHHSLNGSTHRGIQFITCVTLLVIDNRLWWRVEGETEKQISLTCKSILDRLMGHSSRMKGGQGPLEGSHTSVSWRHSQHSRWVQRIRVHGSICCVRNSAEMGKFVELRFGEYFLIFLMSFLIVFVVVVIIIVISGCLKGFREQPWDAEGKCFADRFSRLCRSNFVPITGIIGEEDTQLELGALGWGHYLKTNLISISVSS